ncbi:hypothetical protein C475_03289 [Halosimplex carlsbadense 2-9-1]|uniref:Uncharacterized protein n=1 Tax=Halosimplex carlsbadense 2-9-1 TaxID=797114 RepID=M0D2X9_9EURY|nr:hypothetical protein [Halosimplex carlsbadense]ELZ29208.1 hypothetical protein C475_03289 [Halosimplex carlsbadense 2-9-1]
MSRKSVNHAELLQGWRNVASRHASGPGFDLTGSNPTFRFERRVEDFLDDPTEERFEAFWSAETLLDAHVRIAGLVLNRWDGTVEGLADLLGEMRTADEYDPAWESKLPGQTAWEVYSRFHADESPIVSSHVRSALATLGFDPGSEYASVVETAEAFRSDYEAAVGQVTCGTDHEVHLHVELEQLLLLVGELENAEIRGYASGDLAPLYRPLLGLRSGGQIAGGEISLREADPVFEAYARARNNRAYRDEDTEYWGGAHHERWKWSYHDHLTSELASLSLTALDGEDVPELFDAYEYATSWGATAPKYLLGGQWGTYAWNSVREIATENPGTAAEVFSYLFEVVDAPGDRSAVDSRLAWFEQVFENDRASGGTLLSVATLFLAFYYPENYVLYRHDMMQTFFDRYTDYGFADGYDRHHYRLLNDACHDLVAELDDRMDAEANLLDVHTVFWVLHREGPP